MSFNYKEANLRIFKDFISKLEKLETKSFYLQKEGVKNLMLSIVNHTNVLDTIRNEDLNNNLTPLSTYIFLIKEFEKEKWHIKFIYLKDRDPDKEKIKNINDIFDRVYIKVLTKFNDYLYPDRNIKKDEL